MFPRFGDSHSGHDWVEVMAQGVPSHIGTPSPGHGYERGDPYGDFLPPPLECPPPHVEDNRFRAVVFVRAGTPKEIQRYVETLLVLTGEEYERITFHELERRLCDALRGDRPRVMMEYWRGDGTVSVLRADHSIEEVDMRSGDSPRGAGDDRED
ncbi:MAG: hypothetical protein NDJ94_11385 [Vicinamibacteria bacterium]|nr:hypothetical protein [Vicinamibacteria bacterium]